MQYNVTVLMALQNIYVLLCIVKRYYKIEQYNTHKLVLFFERSVKVL